MEPAAIVVLGEPARLLPLVVRLTDLAFPFVRFEIVRHVGHERRFVDSSVPGGWHVGPIVVTDFALRGCDFSPISSTETSLSNDFSTTKSRQ